MIGLGTILNTAAVAVGGLLGLCLKNGFKKEIKDFKDVRAIVTDS